MNRLSEREERKDGSRWRGQVRTAVGTMPGIAKHSGRAHSAEERGKLKALGTKESESFPPGGGRSASPNNPKRKQARKEGVEMGKGYSDSGGEG